MFWYLFILHENRFKSIDYEQCALFLFCFVLFFHRLRQEFASAEINAIEKCGEDLENIRQLWGFNRGDLNISASAVPNNKDTFKTKRNGKLQHIKPFKQ